MCRIWPWRGGDDALEAFRSDGRQDILHGHLSVYVFMQDFQRSGSLDPLRASNTRPPRRGPSVKLLHHTIHHHCG